MKALGLELYSKAPSAAMTTVVAPAGIDSEKLVKHLFTRYGIKLVGGQDEAKGKIFRIAHLGYFDYMDTIALIGALEQVAHSLKLPGFAFGKALIAAQNVFANRAPDEAARKELALAGAAAPSR
jgi:aspartate aminotransferase-like enzyme